MILVLLLCLYNCVTLFLIDDWNEVVVDGWMVLQERLIDREKDLGTAMGARHAITTHRNLMKQHTLKDV